MKLLKILILGLLLMTGCAAVLWIGLDHYAHSPLKQKTEETVFTIQKGQSLGRTAQTLFESGLIKQPTLFLLIAQLHKSDKQIRAGEYLLSPHMSPIEILSTFTSGRMYLHKITIPEGYTMAQIASVVAQSGLGSKAAFLKAAKDPKLLQSMEIPAGSFEGYLFPDTYHFPKGVMEKEIIKTMVERLRSLITPEWEARARSLKMSLHQVLTLASIIEKETGAAHERPLISSVFHNRLQKKMRLEADPTVIYGILDFSGDITRKDLEAMTPYNTYQIKGLPPGPIANPGKASIEAALFPEQTDYLYFVAKNDKTHEFSTNFKNHATAVRRYQLGRK